MKRLQLLQYAASIFLLLQCCSCMSFNLVNLFKSELQENTISKDSRMAKDKIVLIDISGVIHSGKDQGFMSSFTTPSGVAKILEQIESDKRVKGVILRINSPGGEVTATDIIHQQILRFKKRSKIPVYGSVISIGASGAYYIAMSCDRLYAHPTSVVGSIGVIARIPKLKGLAGKIGYDEVIFKSGDNKDMGHPLRDMSDEQKQIFQRMIDSMYGRFLETIIAGRKGYETKEKLKPIADGRIYTAEDAEKLKLIDDIAYLDDVIRQMKKDQGIKAARVVIYKYGRSKKLSIYSKDQPPQVNLLNINMQSIFGNQNPGFFYLWLP